MYLFYTKNGSKQCSFLFLQKPMPGKNAFLQLWPRMLSAIAVFFDHQYLWKESSHLLDFLRRDNNQKKLVSEATTFGWL